MSDNSYNLKVIRVIGFFVLIFAGLACTGIGLWLLVREAAIIMLGAAMTVAGIVGIVITDV